MEPLVSILIPAYNAENWIADTIRSALAQTWKKIEIIIVDDGSRDQTLAVAKQFASESVAIFAQKNAGAAAARNHALSKAKGDFIQWLDADDLLAPDKIELQLRIAEQLGNKRILISSGWGSFIYRTRTAHFTPTALWRDHQPLEWLRLQMQENLHMQTATWLVSRELTEAAGPWDARLAGCASDDGEYFCRVILKCESIRFVADSKVFYRMPTSQNLSYIGLSEKKMEVQLLALQLYISHVLAVNSSESIRKAGVQFLQNWVHNFYPSRLDIAAKAESFAVTLGGNLGIPKLNWKYAWIQKLFGWPLAKRVSVLAPQLRWSLVRRWEKFRYNLELRPISNRST